MKIKTQFKAPGAELGKSLPDPTKDKSTAPPDEFETKQHMDTLMKAHEILNNPVHLQAVHKLVGRHEKAIKSIQDIKNYRDQKYGLQSLKNSSKVPSDDEGSTF